MSLTVQATYRIQLPILLFLLLEVSARTEADEIAQQVFRDHTTSLLLIGWPRSTHAVAHLLQYSK